MEGWPSGTVVHEHTESRVPGDQPFIINQEDATGEVVLQNLWTGGPVTR